MVSEGLILLHTGGFPNLVAATSNLGRIGDANHATKDIEIWRRKYGDRWKVCKTHHSGQ